MANGGLVDRYGRTAVDLRVSLTDKCNLRCAYCMPAEGLDWLAGPELLSDEEIIRLVDIGVTRLGIRDVRFTGGEPLIRRGLVPIAAAVTALAPRPSVSITTNGIGLAKLARPLADAGLDRVNVSLDTLDPGRFLALTRRDRHHDVMIPDPEHRAASPAETWIVGGYGGAKVGVIGSVTRPFCGDCDRTRLTADGQVRSCLFSRDESDLRAALRSGCSDAEIGDRWRVAMVGKLPGHAINDPTFLQPARPMSAIGG